MKMNRINSGIKTLLVMFVFGIATLMSTFSSYAYDEAVIEYIADAIEDTKTTVYIEGYGVKSDELLDVFELAKAKNYELAYTYDWIRVEGSYNMDGSGNITQFSVKYDFDNKTTNAEVKSRYAMVDAELDRIVAMVDSSWSDEKKLLFVHDYLINKVSYDYDNYLAGTVDDSQFCLYGALVENNAVCEGYSKAFMVIMHRLGYECKLVVSDAMCHMWNVVKVNGSWYHMDLTYDDPIMSGADTDLPGRVSHNYFLLSDTGISKSHYGWYADTPSCTNTKYDNWEYAASTSMFLYIDGYWYYSHPGKNNNLVKCNSSGVETVLTENGAYGLAQVDGRIYYTDKYKKKIYRYYNGTSTLVYTVADDYYISCIAINGTTVTISEFDQNQNYRWTHKVVDGSYNFVTNKVDYTGVVSNVKAVKNASTSVGLSWTAAPGAAGYKVYVYDVKTKKYTLKCNTKATNCTVTGLYSAREYTFVVKAYTKQLDNTVDSKKSVTYKTTTVPNGVSSVTYVNNWNTSVTVKYPAVSGAAGYRLQVTNIATGKTVKTLYVTKLEYKITGLTQGTKYRVVVTPYLKYNGKTYYATTSKNTLAATRMANPTIKASAQTANTITLSWNKVTGATGYYVYKYNASTGKYTFYKDVKTTSCKIDGMYSGKTYTFAIKPYISISYTSNGVKKTDVFFSHSKSFTACTAPLAPKPTLTTASKAVTAKWSKVTGATSYTVYYKTTANGKWTTAGTTTGTSYKISGLTKGKTYYVGVKANKKYNAQNAGSAITTKSIVVK